MHKFINKIGISFVISFIIFLLIIAGSAIMLIFSTSDEGYDTALVNTIYFERTKLSQGKGLEITLGLTGNYINLLVIFVSIFVVVYIIILFFTKLCRSENESKIKNIGGQ